MGIQKNKKEMNFEVKDQCLVIWLDRDLDHHNALYLREKSDQIIERGHIKNIIFDFSHANFMDSSGIGVIMGRYKKVIYTGGRVAVTGVGAAVDRIFTISGLYKIIEKYDSVKEALKVL